MLHNFLYTVTVRNMDTNGFFYNSKYISQKVLFLIKIPVSFQTGNALAIV